MTAPLPPLTIIGHRGARGLAPENTLAGIETALRLGVDGVEFDVQRHPDGGLFLLHDLTLERTTNGQGLAAAQPFDTLRRLDAGHGERVPTLHEVLDLHGAQEPIYHIEIGLAVHKLQSTPLLEPEARRWVRAKKQFHAEAATALIC